LSRFDSILLGDNAFYGIDHLSHERARQRADLIQSVDNAVNVIKCSYDIGIDGMVVATRPKLREIIENIKQSSDMIDKLDFYPVMPYAQGLQLQISEKGIMNMIKDILKTGGLRSEIKIITKGGIGFLKKDMSTLFKVFIDTEMLKLNFINPKIIFLHPVFVDLALSLNMKNVFETFKNHLYDEYKINAGLCTKNFPWLVNKLEEWDLEFASIMTSFNPAGFLMNPSKEACENSLNSYNGHVLAMNIFAGGFSSLNEVIECLSTNPKIRNLVVGASSMEHVKETFTKLRQL